MAGAHVRVSSPKNSIVDLNRFSPVKEGFNGNVESADARVL